MMSRVTKFVLCFVMLGSVACFEEPEVGTAKIGDACERDRNCIRNAFCRAQMTCMCDPYHSPTLDKTMCIATAGLYCTNDTICSTIANGECRQGVCACKETFVLDINNSSNCIGRPAKIGDRCQRFDECQEAFDRAICIDGQCQCFTGHHFVNQTLKCVQTRNLYNSCTMDYECMDIHNLDALECKNGECVCKEGEPRCSKGSLYVAVGIPIILLQLLQRLI